MPHRWTRTRWPWIGPSGAILVLAAGCDLSPLAIYDVPTTDASLSSLDAEVAALDADDPGVADAGAPDAGATTKDAQAIADGDGISDGSTSADSGEPPDASGSFPYAPSNFDPAIGTNRSGAFVLGSGAVCQFDSSALTFTGCGPFPATLVLVPNGNGASVVLLVTSFSIAPGAVLRLTGARPVILAVYGDAIIDGTIDANARAREDGAGGTQGCVAGGGRGGMDVTGIGGGGGGAGHGTGGAAGGTGGLLGTGGPGGSEAGAAPLVPLRGGCRGGLGGDGASRAGGRAGGGGGAIQISASGNLTISGVITAAGGGGQGGAGGDAGGGGGGGGGGILLEGDQVAIAAGTRVLANGGGGGEGAGDVAGDDGQDGSLADTTPAAGGHLASGAGGGYGGYGGAGLGGPGVGEDSPTRGGGGGGGAAGRIRVNATRSCTVGDVTFSPSPTSNAPCFF